MWYHVWTPSWRRAWEPPGGGSAALQLRDLQRLKEILSSNNMSLSRSCSQQTFWQATVGKVQEEFHVHPIHASAPTSANTSIEKMSGTFTARNQQFLLFPLQEITKSVFFFLFLCISGGHMASGSGFRTVEDPAGDRRLDASGSGPAAETWGDWEPAQCNATHKHTHTWSCD